MGAEVSLGDGGSAGDKGQAESRDDGSGESHCEVECVLRSRVREEREDVKWDGKRRVGGRKAKRPCLYIHRGPSRFSCHSHSTSSVLQR